MDARLQPSSPINPCFVSKVRTDPIAIHVGAVFPLAEARQAYQHKPVRGKIVLRVVDGGGAM
jgi:hypothetical protein